MTRDESRFERLFESVRPPLRRFLECLLGRVDLAEEVAQEAFLRFHRERIRGASDDDARFWIFRVARNLALNEIERRETRRRLGDEAARRLTVVPPSPEEDAERAEALRRIDQMLTQLSPDQRAALLLREQEALPYREIARVLGVSESKVRVDIFRARTSLRETWKRAAGWHPPADDAEA